MEIVPILSTIILVGTVATFILAVAAYILYKIREGGSSLPADPKTEQVQPHHVVTPVDYPNMMKRQGNSGPAEASTYVAPTDTSPPREAFIETNNGYKLGEKRGNGLTGEMQSVSSSNDQNTSLDSFFWEYTDEGFNPLEFETDEDENRSPSKTDSEMTSD